MKILIKTMALLAALLLMVVPAVSVFAKSPPPPHAGWFVKRNSEHKQPLLDPSLSYIENYDCYYVDKNHSDNDTDKVLYLTFDAGYENGNIAKILDTLKEEAVPSAFFVLDHMILCETELVKRMADEGHLVCNHTAKHRDMTKMHTKEKIAEELSALETLYKEKIGGEMPKYYRPPEGKLSEENLAFLKELGYKTVMWSFAYADWDNERQPAPEIAKQKILDNTHNGAVILLHPTSATNAKILGDCIKAWKAEGYRFGTLDELTK